MNSDRKLFLLTNDDGIQAPGLRMLIEVVKHLGDVLVVAPDSPQSGQGHAITVNDPLQYSKIVDNGKEYREYSCSGTPADCVKFAINEVLDKKPDICLSGINHGTNASINVLYSGTMSAAIEAGIQGVTSIGFSLCDYSWEANFSVVKNHVLKIIKKTLANLNEEISVLNVNIPKVEDEREIQGVKVCRQAKAKIREGFDKRITPMGKEYYWLTGDYENMDEGQDTDIYALSKKFISIVPTQFDLTAHNKINELLNWTFNE